MWTANGSKKELFLLALAAEDENLQEFTPKFHGLVAGLKRLYIVVS